MFFLAYGFSLSMEFHQGGSAINGATLSGKGVGTFIFCGLSKSLLQPTINYKPQINADYLL